MGALRRSSAFRSTTSLHLPAELASIAISLAVGVPFAIALFKQVRREKEIFKPDFVNFCVLFQEMEVPVERLEPEFHGLVDKHGVPIKTVKFFKGL